MNVLLTGATGNLGPAICSALNGCRIIALVRAGKTLPNVENVAGSLENLPLHLVDEIDVIIHAAALTDFRAPYRRLHTVNVEGTANLLAYAAQCPRLMRLVHVSTTCVCGTSGGVITETVRPTAPEFVNEYERTKWEAEQLVLASDLPVEIARVSIVIGSELDGNIATHGAFHHFLHWLRLGLIPMIPGSADVPVDLISTEFAARGIVRAVTDSGSPQRIRQIAAGIHAPKLGAFLPLLQELLSEFEPAWIRGARVLPDFADAATWNLFERGVRQTGDALLTRVLDSGATFLPALLHPRTYETREPAPADWQTLVTKVANRLYRHA